MHDIVIQNAKIIDGTGGPAYISSLAIEQGNIVEISNMIEVSDSTPKVIDGSNLILTPGFVDISNHSDTHLSIFSMPSQKSLITQGITSIIGGNCGASLAPLLSSEAIYSIQKWGDVRTLNINWQTFEELLQEFTRLALAPNIGSFVGYSTIRRGLIGDSIRPLSPQELQLALNAIDNALSEGALGVSLGMAFSHMRQVDPQEIEQIAHLLHKHNKLLAVHLRSDGEKVIQSIKDVIALVKRTQVKLHINHLKILGKRHWKYFEELYTLLQYGVEKNLPITFDVFPYTANNSVAYLILPDWASLGGKTQLLKNLADTEIRIKIINEMKQNSIDYSRIIIADARIDRSIIGKNIQEIAYNQGVGIEEALIQLIIASDGQARIIIDGINKYHLDSLIRLPNCIISSDGVGYDDSFLKKNPFEHPRCYGAMIEFIQTYILSGNISWEEGIAKISFLPAHIMQLPQRGLIREGMKADILLLDPLRIHASATFSHPIRYSEGVKYSIINGKILIDDSVMSNNFLKGDILSVKSEI